MLLPSAMLAGLRSLSVSCESDILLFCMLLQKFSVLYIGANCVCPIVYWLSAMLTAFNFVVKVAKIPYILFVIPWSCQYICIRIHIIIIIIAYTCTILFLLACFMYEHTYNIICMIHFSCCRRQTSRKSKVKTTKLLNSN